MVLIVVIKIVTFCLEVVVRRVSNKDSVFKLTSFCKEKANYQLATGKGLLNIYRRYQRCSVKKDVLQTFVNFTEKLLCWNLFLNKERNKTKFDLKGVNCYSVCPTILCPKDKQ